MHKRKTTSMWLTSLKREYKMEFDKIVEVVKVKFKEKLDEYWRQWGGGNMGTNKSYSKVKSPLKFIIVPNLATANLGIQT